MQHMADHKTIECVIPNLLLHHNVAIIGSSARLLQDPVGEQIDQYNEVVRFNRAPTDGYEEYVGAKTTLRVTNNHVFNNNDIKILIYCILQEISPHGGIEKRTLTPAAACIL